MSTETATSPHIAWEEPNAVQVRVVLEGIQAAIWRRLVVQRETTLAQLHDILQAAMGWTDSHLHQFEIGGLGFGDPTCSTRTCPTNTRRRWTPARVRLRDFHFDHEGTLSFVCTYDFGDSWRHTVTVDAGKASGRQTGAEDQDWWAMAVDALG